MSSQIHVRENGLGSLSERREHKGDCMGMSNEKPRTPCGDYPNIMGLSPLY